MLRYVPIIAAATTGALYVKERRSRLAISRLGAATLETLLNAIDTNSPITGEHVRRVADYSLILGRAADRDERMLRSIERVALFHDIGKIDGALIDIVSESTKLTPDERRAIRMHPKLGADVLNPLATFYPDLPAGVLAHHERWDGTGYPRRLRGRRIPFASRVVAIADTFDAVTHSRSYHTGQSVKRGLEVIAQGRETQFDPDLVDLFLCDPVLKQIREAMRKALSPRRRRGKRKDRPAHTHTPDISFRWRTQDPLPRKAHR